MDLAVTARRDEVREFAKDRVLALIKHIRYAYGQPGDGFAKGEAALRLPCADCKATLYFDTAGLPRRVVDDEKHTHGFCKALAWLRENAPSPGSN